MRRAEGFAWLTSRRELDALISRFPGARYAVKARTWGIATAGGTYWTGWESLTDPTVDGWIEAIRDALEVMVMDLEERARAGRSMLERIPG